LGVEKPRDVPQKEEVQPNRTESSEGGVVSEEPTNPIDTEDPKTIESNGRDGVVYHATGGGRQNDGGSIDFK